MGKPENKPDLAIEDVEKPKEGAGTKTAELVKVALSKALLARAAEQATRRSKAMAHGLEDLGSRAIVPRDVKSSMGHEIAKLQRQGDVFASRGRGVAPKATSMKRTRETIKAMGPRVNMADAEAAQMAGAYGDSVRAMNAKMDANLAQRAIANDSTRAARGRTVVDATKPGVAPPPLPGTNAVTPSQAQVPVSTAAATGQRAGMMQQAAPSSADAGKTYVGGVPPSSATADATRMPGPVAPQAMSPERRAQLIAANPQLAPAAPVQQVPVQLAPMQNSRPPSFGRQTLVLGSAGLAGAMMNRPAQQQQAAY